MDLEFRGSVIKQVESILHEAIKAGVSDIHIEPYEKKYRLRYRIDGVLQEVSSLQFNQKDAMVSRIKVMADLDIAEKRRPQDGRIKFRSKDGNEIDIRISILPTQHGEKVVLRILDKSQLQLKLESLGFDEEILKDFRKAIHNPYGMVLVTGPTGSGKTTTLYAALNELNTQEVNITTIEDPIEYNLEGINQTQVHEEIGLTFAHALRSILRQDPNIIMVGEIRDKETAEIAIRSALTGHMVFSTLHTNDAASAVSRLVDMGVEPFLLASSIRMVMAQRLVRKICSNCKAEYKPDLQILKDIGLQANGTYWTGEGCEACNHTGFKGRTALIELLVFDNTITEKILQNADAGELKIIARENGMTTLREAGIEKVKNSVTTVEEIYRETVL
ncbi:GspE/PulE family protein [Gracilimonas tropica]|uniref:GspE/PulE family protein n=1 Tax=Gracilimonas tropica TaxID=454600 RepID=UPI00036F5BC1|nr:GspE/PulE family protein [Gracilimonas tropica]